MGTEPRKGLLEIIDRGFDSDVMWENWGKRWRFMRRLSLRLVALGLLLACDSSTEPRISDVHGQYVLTDTLANGSWIHVTSGSVTLSDNHEFVMALPSVGGPVGYQGEWELNPGFIMFQSNPVFFLELITSDMGKTSGAQIIVTDGGPFAVGRVSGSYAFKSQ